MNVFAEILNLKILICLSRFDTFNKTFRLKLFGFYITENKKTQSKKFVFKHKRSDSIRQLSKNILSLKSFFKVWLDSDYQGHDYELWCKPYYWTNGSFKDFFDNVEIQLSPHVDGIDNNHRNHYDGEDVIQRSISKDSTYGKSRWGGVQHFDQSTIFVVNMWHDLNTLFENQSKSRVLPIL